MELVLIVYELSLRCIMVRSLTDSSIEVEFLISDESPYFSHYACEMLRATDVKVISENVAKVRKPP